MARWQRDPKTRRRLTWLLVGAEVLALTGNFYPIFFAYLYQVFIRLGHGPQQPLVSHDDTGVISVVFTCVVFVVAFAEGAAYARGQQWARRAMIAENVILVALGLFWFLKNRLGGGSPSAVAAVAGVILPMVTLFPLLWPLLAFRPVDGTRDEAG